MTADVDMLTEAMRLLEQGMRLALCTIIEKQGSGPRDIGTKMIVREDGITYGTIGGGTLERALVDECVKTLQERTVRTITFNLTGGERAGTVATGLICGGQMVVFIDVLEPDPRLIIVGSGHVALPLARLADVVGFGVTIIDDDAERANEGCFPMAETIVVGDFTNVVSEFKVRPDDFVVIAHGNPERDYAALKAIAEKKPAYIGLLGSKTKVAHLVKRLQWDGISVEELTMLHAPVGVTIGAQTPEEIGISILAEIIQHKRNGAYRSARGHQE
ncbi:MAG: XdhC family protein [Halobacteriota archaeon]